MRKPIITLALLAATDSLLAAEIYSLDGVTIDLTGEAELQYIKTQSRSKDMELNISEANAGIDVIYEMTEDFAFGSYIEIEANGDDYSDDSNKDAEVTRGDVYMSLFYQDAHTLTFGAQSTIFDDMGIGDDYEFEFTSFVGGAIDDSGDQVVKYKYDGGEVFYAGLAYLANKNSSDPDIKDEDFVLDGNIGARIEDLELTLFAAFAKANDLDRNSYVFEARYNLGDFTLEGTYGDTEIENHTGSDTDVRSYGFALSWQNGGRFEYVAGWASVDNDSENDVINDFYANVTYSFTDKVRAYAEVGVTDESGTDTGYVIGMNAIF